LSSESNNLAGEPPTERIAADDDLDTTRIVDSSEDAATLDEPHNDKLFEQYTIYSKIGSGGMGVVYLARDRRLGRFVAIKRLNYKAQSIKSLRQRFLHEARAVAALSHVYVIHIYALGEDEDGPFIVMEYIAGPDGSSVESKLQSGGLVQPNRPLTLEQHVKDLGQLSTDEALELLLKISGAVSYAHESGVIHRDLKPSNILMDKSNEPKIVDFGLARLIRKDEPKITVPGEKLLSIGYGAPEQESDASLSDERADVYGLGALLYFTITGQNPRYFREQDLPVELREIAVKALATDKENRWQSVREFADELNKIATRTRVETPTVKTTWHCKWCDSINPMSIKFCAECGWDGSEKCPECGGDTFFGVQYCNNCGADARAYESIISLLNKMKTQEQINRYERVLSYAGRTHGFEPAGPSGRNLLKDISDLRLKSNEAIRKRKQLKEQIPIEIRAENFERAKRCIEQYRNISEEKTAFESEYQQVPEKILERDMTRAGRAIHSREWEQAAKICNEMQTMVAPENPAVIKLKKSIKLHYRLLNFSYGMVALLLVPAIYLLSLPVAAKFSTERFGRVLKIIYTPASWCYEKSSAALPLAKYASMWTGEENITSYFDNKNLKADAGLQTVVNNPEELEAQRLKYQQSLSLIYEKQRIFLQDWPVEYNSELETLLDKYQRAGDYDGWEIVQNELTRFEQEGTVTTIDVEEPLEFVLLAQKYVRILEDQKLLHSRNLIKKCKLYINSLEEMKKKYTQEGRIQFAAAVHSEINNATEVRSYVEAEKVIASSDRNLNAESPSDVLLSAKGDPRVGEVAGMRKSFENSINKATAEYANQINAWPMEYLKRLSALKDEFQKAGDYDGWEEVSTEVERFEVDLEIGPEHLLLYLPKLMQVQNEFRLKRDKYKISFFELVVKKTEGYLSKLQNLQKRLTVNDRMEDAAEVNNEIRRVRFQADYIEAKKAVAIQGPPEPPPNTNPTR